MKTDNPLEFIFLTINSSYLTLYVVLTDYTPVLLIIIFAIFLASLLITISYFLGPKRRKENKLTPYESGIDPVGDARERFSLRYYLIGALFILFDVEAVFLFVWAVVFRDLGMLAFIEIVVFLIIILTGYYYVLKKRVIEWD